MYQLSFDRCQYLLVKNVLTRQMPKEWYGAFIRRAYDGCILASKLAIQRDVMHRLLHGRVRVPEEQLQQVNAQDHLCRIRWPSSPSSWTIRCDQRQHLSPLHCQIHLDHKLALACALSEQLESRVGKAHLFDQSF